VAKRNDDIRQTMAQAGVYQWEIAEYINMSESNFYRVMRHELKPDLRNKVLDAIREISKQKGKGA
jgi:hypothetical protein